MCGIVGGNIQGDWIDKCLNHMEHRGPDGFSKETIDNITFGHRRLSIIDLSERGKQPIRYKNLMMTFNGEIYNYQYLRSYLNADDDLFQSSLNDAHVAIRYIHKYGVDKFLDRASGMWAFAIYNSDTKEIGLYTDPFNQKPIYYYHSEGIFAFASEPVCLYWLKSKWELDYDALETYWMLGGVIGENQLLKGIKKVLAGEEVIFKKTVRKRKWYQIKPSKDNVEQLIYEAIDEMKVSDVPVALFLSGGIDSSIVASRLSGTAIHLDSPEREYAQEVANKYKLDFKVCTPTDYQTSEILTDYVSKTGEPTMAGAIPWITAKETRAFGKVAVIANGADELFFGYDRLKGDDNQYSVHQNNHLFRGSLFSHEKLNQFRKGTSRKTELDIFIQYDLNRTLDFASMCHGLEVRSPFLNRKLVEAALSIPEEKHRQNGNKSILKAILHKHGFPHAFTDRPKQGFSLHFKPLGFEQESKEAFNWAVLDGYILMKQMAPRCKSYLQSSALGFRYWFNKYKSIIA